MAKKASASKPAKKTTVAKAKKPAAPKTEKVEAGSPTGNQ